ncbi:MAG: NADH-quinone oxidoreductase subunit J [Opitutaceae bacterium]|jgi:NADH:ubiquinone oxidoreductase subunit 6 (subunit J)
MTVALIFIAVLMLGSAATAMVLRNLIHSALLLIASWAGVAAFYLWAGAEFVAFAQVLVYVGAISMVVLFAVLLTRQNLDDRQPAEPASRARALAAVLIGASVAGVITATVLSTSFKPSAAEAPNATVKQIGLDLMESHGATLLIVGVILTVALLGATVIAATDKKSDPEDAQ